MALNFPNNPALNEVYRAEGAAFTWNGSVWIMIGGGDGSGGVPVGGIIMWSGAVAAIPTGWSLCDGNNGTPNLQDRFIVGAGAAYVPGATGGANTVTLAESQIPAHAHAVNLNTDAKGGHTHQYAQALGYNFVPVSGSVTKGFVNGGGYPNETFRTTNDPGNHTHNVSGNTGAKGGGAAHENRPPYYALAYIMKQ